MSKQYKYINQNPFPVFLPDGRGGQVMFRSGEGTTKQWFSRLCGERQLTRVPVGKSFADPGNRPFFINHPEDVNVPVVAPPPVRKDASFPTKETDTYVLERGIYKCKLCDIFMTGSMESLQAHMLYFHQRPLQDSPPAPKIEEKKKPEAVPEKPQEPEPPEELDLQPEPESESVFTCEFPGCHKQFASKRGLNMHQVRMGHNK